MFTNYLKATYRHLIKNKINFLFKLGGLTLALFSFLVIALYVSFQLSFDKYHYDYENIYRVNSNRDEDGKMEQYAMVPPAIGPAIKAGFPEIRSFTRLSESNRAFIRYNEKLMRLRGFAEADSSLFNVFTFEFIKGDRRALSRPGTIVLTSSLSIRIFGDEDPIGKLISFPDRQNKSLEVAAIIKDLPANTHLNFSAVMPFNAFEGGNNPSNDSWEITWDGSVHLYVRLNHQENPNQFSDKINPVIAKNVAKREDGGEKKFSVFLQPITEIYLGPNMNMEFFENGNGLYVYIFSLLSIFLLVIASFNYINLSIADFHSRSKEIGVRKILGARKKQIAFQVTLETLFLCFLGLLISLIILYLLFPKVLVLLDPNLKLEILLNTNVMALIIFTVLFLAAFSTAYPAFQLSMNNPISDLSKGVGFGNSLSISKTLLLFQFIISIICISATLIVGSQVDYINTKDLGYDRTNLISLIMPDEYPLEKAAVLKDEVSRLTGVVSTSYSHYHMTGVPYFKGEYEVEADDAMKQTLISEVFVDHDFLKTMGVKTLLGRNFDINNPADSHKAFIVNETAVKEFGWTDPLGKKIRVKQTRGEIEKWEGIVVGVVQDFNTRPLREKVEPVVMRLPYDSWPGYCLNVRIDRSISEALPLLKTTYEKVIEGFPIDYRIVGDMYDSQYRDENKALAALQVGAWMVALISSIGIFSLSAYMSIRRMKEFGIRKVLGATSRQITLLHVGGFMKIVLVANVIALPIAYWLMKEWLVGFAYRTNLGGIIFITVTAISFLLVIVSAGYSSLRAGKMNPVDVIKIQ
ncbi:MAG: ABC transporter permease [Cyclobacteriaceae bacterium]|nr:ABC transporter permease [Cyclobacteriaceae bacterium]